MTSFNMDDFGNYTDLTKVTDKKVTEDDKWASFNGNSFSRQNGNATSYQIGNKNAFQHGYSNSVIVGMSFSTSLAATFSTTVGMSVSTTVGLAIASHLGAKAAVFGGMEASINASAAVKVTKGGTYTFDTVEKWETAEQKTVATAKELKLAKKTVQLVEGEIKTISMNIDNVCRLHKISTGDIEHLALYKATLGGSFKTTCGSLTGETILNGKSVKIAAIANTMIWSKGTCWINGAIVNLG